MRIFNANGSGINPQDFPGSVAELKYIAGKAFDCEVLVDGSDERLAGFQQNAIIAVIGDSAAGSKSEQAGTSAAANSMIHGVVMEQGSTPASFGAKAFGQHPHNLIEFVAGQVAIWPGRSHEFKQCVFIPIACGGAGHDLLGEDV